MANASMILRSSSVCRSSSSSSTAAAPYAASTRFLTTGSVCRLGPNKASFYQGLRLNSRISGIRGNLLLPSRRRKLILFSASEDSGYLSLGIIGGEAEGADEDEILADKDESNISSNDPTSVKNDSSNAVQQKVDNTEPVDKFVEVLKGTTEQLKEKAEQAGAALQPFFVTAQEQAEKARETLVTTASETAAVLAATAQETAEKSKENISYIAENAPEPIKEIAETALKAHSAEKPPGFAKIHDFCLGIPYGASLVAGGLLWFIISGSTAGIRFGVILGGALLALSVSSLNAWKKGNSSTPYVKGQAALTSIIMIREVRRLFQGMAIPTAFIALASVAMLGFYIYVYLAGGNPPPKHATGSPA